MRQPQAWKRKALAKTGGARVRESLNTLEPALKTATFFKFYPKSLILLIFATILVSLAQIFFKV